ncbi:hypothetical protein P9D34_08385 [Bacillus swezeyi]|nr:hypothetical protein [Bacillus swezeyi]MEC1260458.1 hypothetical protein [Bacillus swezeyi]MED2929561.1 hypothetical protein [Bacillus swezeyi]MED2963412.1 hypothetical protein [Bacillus swezeyi]MED2979232.1 hypothetical protein [Bacillus swezeyi]MED3073363.1 hypothetical protein [Bacillus swezeyi]
MFEVLLVPMLGIIIVVLVLYYAFRSEREVKKIVDQNEKILNSLNEIKKE